MSKLTAAFTDVGISETLHVPVPTELAHYELAGTFVAKVYLESTIDGGISYQPLAILTEEYASPNFIINPGMYRFRCSSFTSGEADASLTTIPQPNVATDSYPMMIETPDNKTYTIDLFVPVGRTIESVTAITGSGTITLQFQRNGADITGLDAVEVTDSEQTVLPVFDDSNLCAVGDTLTVIASDNASAADLVLSVAYSEP